jgi:HSP20 family molecular chaperone IbpA
MKKLTASIFALVIAVLPLGAAPVLSSSMSLEETDSAYTVRIGVTEKTPVNVRLAGRRLLLDTAVAATKGPRYEQSLQLPAAAPDASLGIQRDSSELVITVPKGGPSASAAATPDSLSAALAGLNNLDPMRDDMIKQAQSLIKQFGQTTKPASDGSNGIEMLQFLLNQSGLAGVTGGGVVRFDLREEPDRFILSSAIPQAQAKNVSVNVDNERFVTITIKQGNSSQNGGLSAFSGTSSIECLTLPGPVAVDRMTMDYKKGRLEVSLPKI